MIMPWTILMRFILFCSISDTQQELIQILYSSSARVSRGTSDGLPTAFAHRRDATKTVKGSHHLIWIASPCVSC